MSEFHLMYFVEFEPNLGQSLAIILALEQYRMYIIKKN